MKDPAGLDVRGLEDIGWIKVLLSRVAIHACVFGSTYAVFHRHIRTNVNTLQPQCNAENGCLNFRL